MNKVKVVYKNSTIFF